MKEPNLEERILILGTGSAARTVAREIRSQHDFAYRVVGFVADAPTECADADVLILGSASELTGLIVEHRIDRIIVGLTDRRGQMPTRELLQAKLSGVRVEDAATTYERLTGKILLDELKPSWLVFSDGFRASRVTRFVKRGVRAGARRAGGAPLICSRHLRFAWIPPGLFAGRVGETAGSYVVVPLDADRR
jgi:hypothetical protein